jgi:hypothetical protein
MEEIWIDGKTYDTSGKLNKNMKVVVLLYYLDGRYLQTLGLFNLH